MPTENDDSTPQRPALPPELAERLRAIAKTFPPLDDETKALIRAAIRLNPRFNSENALPPDQSEV